MDYSLAGIDEKMKVFCDKIGSDYFVMKVLLMYFETSTYDFVNSQLKVIEKTQEVVEAIRPLIKNKKVIAIRDENDTERFITPLPVNYHRLVAYDVIYKDGSKCIRADLKQHARSNMDRNNPYREATKDYPEIVQEANLFGIRSGIYVPEYLKLVYCKKPSFATTGKKDNRIVDLPDDSIEEIILKVCTHVFKSTGDERVQVNNSLEESFAKVFK